MRDGRGARLVLEAVFLFAVAGVLAYAEFRPRWIILGMLAAWAIVALFEWVAWRERPHWASGSPPRYHVPERPLPPRPPTTELPSFSSYPRPAVREAEAPTWIATPEMRAEAFGWPLSEGEEAGEAEEAAAEQRARPAEPQTTVEESPAELLAEAEAAATRSGPEPAEGGPELSAPRTARHRIDPFAEDDAPRRPWGRRPAENPVAELPGRPRHSRIAPRDGGRSK